MKYYHNLDPIDIRQIEESRRFDEEMDENYEQWLNNNKEKRHVSL